MTFCIGPTAFFVRPFYKMMLNRPVIMEDMQSVVSSVTVM